MCNPVMMIAAAGMQGLMAFQQGQAQKSAYEMKAQEARAQADFQNRQANLEQISGQFQQRRQMEKLDALGARQLNLAAASGFSTSGSPTDVILDSRREGMLDVAAIRFGADLKSDNLTYQAGVSQMNAKNFDSSAESADGQSYLGAIAPFINLAGDPTKVSYLGRSFGMS